jgi:acetyltransferase-like isoleucine patch superfamily enzyme
MASSLTSDALARPHPGAPVHGGGRWRPAHWLASLWHSRHCGWRSLLARPIAASPGTRIAREAGASLTVGSKLVLGYGHINIGQDRFQSRITSLDLGAHSRFEVEGYAALGPGVGIAVGDHATFSIGDGSYISADATVLCTTEVRIGRNCALAWGLMIMDTDFHELVRPGLPWRDRAPVRIGDHVWVGAQVTILRGVTIGDGAVIGAGSVVTHDVPPDTLVRGNPAAVVREHVVWRD